LKKILVFALMCLLGASFVPAASAAIEGKYTVMPYSGAYDQKIMIYVRCTPLVDTEPKTVYIFWDQIQVNKLPSTQVAKTTSYQHLWDITVVPLAGYNGEGDHVIDIWIENKQGEILKFHWTYKITDGLPPLSAWDRYLAAHPEILAEITGPKGDKGDVGGVGARGAKGDTGARGQTAQIDYAELWRSVPPDVLAEMRGEPGAAGGQGDPASMVTLAVSCVVSVIASAMFTWYYAKPKEVVV